jgi:hypothetical protein
MVDTKKKVVKKKTVKKIEPKQMIKQTNKQIVNVNINTDTILKKKKSSVVVKKNNDKKVKKNNDNKAINVNWTLQQKKRFSSLNTPNNTPLLNSNASILLNEIIAKNNGNSLYNNQTIESKENYNKRLNESTIIQKDDILDPVVDEKNKEENVKIINRNIKPMETINLTSDMMKETLKKVEKAKKIVKKRELNERLNKIDKLAPLPSAPIFNNSLKRIFTKPKIPIGDPFDFGPTAILSKKSDNFDDVVIPGRGIVKTIRPVHCSVCKKNGDNSERSFSHNKTMCSFYPGGGKFKS